MFYDNNKKKEFRTHQQTNINTPFVAVENGVRETEKLCDRTE